MRNAVLSKELVCIMSGLASTAMNGKIDATPSISRNAINKIMPIST
jgi:hypothetical protein